MKEKGIVLLAILIIILVAVIGGGFVYLESTDSIDVIKSKSTSTTIISLTTNTTSTTVQGGATTTAAGGTTETTSSEGVQIKITAPVANQLVSSPLSVKGTALNLFENTCVAKLKDSTGAVLATKVITTNAPDMGQWGTFDIALTFSAPTTPTGTLEVFGESPASGNEVGKITVKVKFQ